MIGCRSAPAAEAQPKLSGVPTVEPEVPQPVSEAERWPAVDAETRAFLASAPVSQREAKGVTERGRVRLSHGAVLCASSGSVVDFGGGTDWPPGAVAAVNAANRGGVGGGGVDGAFCRAGGELLHSHRCQLPVLEGTWNERIRTGDAVATGPARYGALCAATVIHAVGPNYLEGGTLEECDEALAGAYRASMRLARERGIGYVGFALLSAGIFRGPRSLRDVLEVAVSTVATCVYPGLQEVHLVGFKDEEINLLLECMQNLPSPEELQAAADARKTSSPLEDGYMVMSRYRIKGEPLGEGGWCVVYRALDIRSNKHVAVKTYRNQCLRDSREDTIADRFAKEVAAFKALGLAPDAAAAGKKAWYQDPQQLFVNLLDFSRGGAVGPPARAADGRFYTVLELADGGSLENWLPKRSAQADEALAQLRDVGQALAASLAWLAKCSLCHCDLKPANIMRFGGRWKIIDIEGAVSMSSPSATVKPDDFTPLYACPELGRAWLDALATSGGVSGRSASCAPAASMDVWSAGVVLLDVLARQCAFDDTFTGFQSAAFNELDGTEEDDAPMGLKEWYEWLVDPAPVLPGDHASPAALAATVGGSELDALLRGLLAKDPSERLTTEQFRAHPALGLAEEAEAAAGEGQQEEDERPAKCRCLGFRRRSPSAQKAST